MQRALFTALTTLAACGGTLAETPWLPGDERARVSTCRIDGKLESETVVIALDDDTFGVGFDEPTPITVTLGESAPMQVRAISPHLVIQAAGRVPLRAAGTTSTARGMVTLSDRLALQDARIVGGRLLASLSVDDEINLPDLPIDCSQIATGDPVDWRHGKGTPVVPDPDQTWTTAGRLARTRTEDLNLHAAPRAGYPLRMQITSEFVLFDVLAEEPDWTEIGWRRFDGGVMVRGWVPSDSIEVLPNDGSLNGSAGGGGGEIDCCGAYEGNRKSTRRTTTLMPGTTIHASAGGSAWAEITAVVFVEIETFEGETWSRVLVLPGVHETGCPDHAWVANAGLL